MLHRRKKHKIEKRQGTPPTFTTNLELSIALGSNLCNGFHVDDDELEAETASLSQFEGVAEKDVMEFLAVPGIMSSRIERHLCVSGVNCQRLCLEPNGEQ